MSLKKYGSLIAKLRKKQGLTQEQLGTKLNVSYQAVSKWEHDLSEPDLTTIEKLAEIFNITVSDFFDMTNNPDKIYSNNKSDIAKNEVSNNKSRFGLKTFIKHKPWYLVAGLGCIILLLSLIVALAPIKYSSSKIYKIVDPSVFCITLESESGKQAGSGFFINDKGLAVTNYHVIKGATSGQIQLNNGKKYNIKKVVGCDENLDIAIIQIDIKKSKPVKLGNSNKVKVGETVYAIGYPESFELGSVDSTLTQGIVSKKSYTIDGNTYIQTTANITHGNSGGVLVNQSGKVIGIMTLMAGDVDYMNMAIPINKIKSVKRNLKLTLEQLTERNKDHTLTYMSDGVSVGKVTVSYNKRTEPKTISKSGYIFEGWYTDTTYTKLFDFNQSIIANTTVYAKWTPIKYTIRFDANGGTGTMSDIQCTYDQTYILPVSGFTNNVWLRQHGWFLNDNWHPLGNVVENLTTVDNAVLIFEAYWVQIRYSLTFETSNDLVEMWSIPPRSSYYYTDTTFTLHQPTFQNYTFIGWTGEGITTPQLTVTIPQGSYGDRVYIAHWKAIEYPITYNLNGGEKGDDYYPSVYTYDIAVLPLPTPVRFGYTFLGWRENGSTVTKTSIERIEGKMYFEDTFKLIKAEWKKTMYSITYITDNPFAKPILEENKNSYSSLDEAFDLPNISANHFEFIGWTSENILTPQMTVTIPSGTEGNLVFMSHWTPITYSITYNNIDEFEKDDTFITEYTYEMQSCLLPTLTREDSNFIGWETEDGSVINNIPIEPYKNLVLTPVWEEKTYRLTYADKNGAIAGQNIIKWSSFPYEVIPYSPDGCYYFDYNIYSDIECSKMIADSENSYIIESPSDFTVYLNAYYTKDQFTYKEEGYINGYNGNSKDVYIPQGTTVVNGFNGNNVIENVYIPEGVLTVANFQTCRYLKYINLPSTLTKIGGRCFYECYSLKEIVLPDGLEELGSWAFAFSAITEITIPNKITELDTTFKGCKKLEKVVLSEGLTKLKGQTFVECINLKHISLPMSLIELGSNFLLDAAFAGSGLIEITIPSNVEVIGSSTFSGNSNLIKIDILSNKITNIAEKTFYNCTSLKTITLSSGITNINSKAFEGCEVLETIYYKGTKKQFEAIEVADGNECFTNAKVYYFASEQPETEGDYWYYDSDGNVVVWEY